MYVVDKFGCRIRRIYHYRRLFERFPAVEWRLRNVVEPNKIAKKVNPNKRTVSETFSPIYFTLKT